MLSPLNRSPLASCTKDWNSRSSVLAATVSIQGATFETVAGAGPEFPAEQTTVIPCLTAWKEPMAMPSAK
ncbi:hypothetical protein YC2023_019166 [Brassica napus]